MTIEKFELEFNLCDTIVEKNKILKDFIESGIDLDSNESKEFISECKYKIEDILEQESIEQDFLINVAIDNGDFSLYDCTESVEQYRKDSTYYVKVVDIADDYRKTGIGETNPLINELINLIKPIYWIVTDDGIGTLKRKNILSENIDFKKHFSKFV